MNKDYHDNWEDPDITPMGVPLKPIKRNYEITRDEIIERHRILRDYEGYDKNVDRDTGRTHKD